MVMDVAGLFAACLAAVVVYWLAGEYRLVADDARWRHLLVVLSGRRAKHVAFAVALCVHAAVLLSTLGTSRDLAAHLQETDAKLTRMEQIIQNQEKHHNEMINSLASMLSKNSDDIKLMTDKVTKVDGTPNSESSITVEEPPQGETMDQELPKRSDGQEEDAPAPCPPDGSSKPHKQCRWRTFPVPEDHVFAVDCVGGELTVHIRSASLGSSKHSATCSSGGGDQQLPFTCGHPPEAGTPSFYDGGSYRALFWSQPGPDGQERVWPIPWAREEVWERLSTAMLESNNLAVDDPPMVEELTSPEPVTLSTDLVMFYGPSDDGRTKVLIAPTEDVEHLYSMEEQGGGPVVTALAPYSILPTYSGPRTSDAFYLPKEEYFRAMRS